MPLVHTSRKIDENAFPWHLDMNSKQIFPVTYMPTACSICSISAPTGWTFKSMIDCRHYRPNKIRTFVSVNSSQLFSWAQVLLTFRELNHYFQGASSFPKFLTTLQE